MNVDLKRLGARWRVLTRIVRPKMEVTGRWIKWDNKEPTNWCTDPAPLRCQYCKLLRRIMGWRVNTELEIMRKEVVVV